MSENEKDLDAIYQKVSSTIKYTGGDEVWKIYVTEFKGIPDCAKRLDQFSDVISGCDLTYEERDGFFTVNIEGSCDFSSLFNLETLACDELTEEEIKIFFSLLPKKDDFWGWCYRVEGCADDDLAGEYEMEIFFADIIAALIDPNYKETVNIIYNGEEICEVER